MLLLPPPPPLPLLRARILQASLLFNIPTLTDCAGRRLLPLLRLVVLVASCSASGSWNHAHVG